jgi:hypothetical protein
LCEGDYGERKVDKNAEGITETGIIPVWGRRTVFDDITVSYDRKQGFVSAFAMYCMYVLDGRKRILVVFAGGRGKLYASAGAVHPHRYVRIAKAGSCSPSGAGAGNCENSGQIPHKQTVRGGHYRYLCGRKNTCV